MTARIGCRTAVWGFVAVSAACTLAPSVPQVSTYALDEANVRRACVPAETKHPSAGTLVVSTPRARPGFDSPRMAYVRRPYTLDFYARSRWVDAPPRLLAPLIAACLVQTGRFAAVALGPTSVAADWRLDTDIEYLQQEFTKSPSQFRVGLRVQLVDLRTGTITGQRYFERAEAAPSDDPYGGVRAANRAVGATLQEVARWTVSETRGTRP
jgi:cholesterol transport system auxiliary component